MLLRLKIVTSDFKNFYVTISCHESLCNFKDAFKCKTCYTSYTFGRLNVSSGLSNQELAYHLVRLLPWRSITLELSALWYRWHHQSEIPLNTRGTWLCIIS